MGIYYKAVNLDKREYVDPHTLGSGAKFRQNFHKTGLAGALMYLLDPDDPQADGIAGRWAGDRVTLAHDAGLPRASIVDWPQPRPIGDLLYDAVEDGGWKDISEQVRAYIELVG